MSTYSLLRRSRMSDKESCMFMSRSFFVLTVVMLLVNLGTRMYAQNTLTNGIHTNAVVVGVANVGTGKTSVTRPVVEYKVGTTQVVLSVFYVVYVPEVGETIEVVYHKDNLESVLMAGFDPWALVLDPQVLSILVALGSGLFFLLIYWVLSGVE